MRRAAVVAMLLLSACRDTDTRDEEPTGDSRSPRNEAIITEDVFSSVDVWTWIGQSRHLEGTRRVTVPVRFDSHEPVVVTGIALRAPHFEPLAPEPKDSLLHPGRRVALQVDVGAPRCDQPLEGSPEVHLEARLADGPPETLVLPVPSWLLDRLHERECTLAAMAEETVVRFGRFEPASGTTVRTELVVERRASRAPIVVERVAGSVILGLEPERHGTPVIRLDPDEDHARIPVEVTATRCDAHGLAGSQKTFVFSVWVAVGDDPGVALEIEPAPELEAAMRDAIDSCIGGSS